jgi:hypothetical protein
MRMPLAVNGCYVSQVNCGTADVQRARGCEKGGRQLLFLTFNYDPVTPARLQPLLRGYPTTRFMAARSRMPEKQVSTAAKRTAGVTRPL